MPASARRQQREWGPSFQGSLDAESYHSPCVRLRNETPMWRKRKEIEQGLDLEDFVRDTILSIFRAVQDAGHQIATDPDRRGAVVPLWGGIAHVSNHEQTISFDVAVTVTRSKSDDVKPSIKVPTLAELGGTMSNRNDATRVSRVSFSVPVALPGTEVRGTVPQPRAGRP